MKSVSKLVNKLRKPPAVHNWVKNIHKRRDDTALALHNFAINPPRTSLLSAVSICVQIVVDGISLDQAFQCADAIKDLASRDRARWIIQAFHPHAKAKAWRGIQVFRDMVEFYPVSAGVRVPVRPTFVLNDDGKLTPYFLICWAHMSLSVYQRRILSTIVSEAILTLEEFQGSDAYIVCPPVAPHSKKERHVMMWNVSDFDPLDDDEKRVLFDRYAAAMSDAEKMLIESLS